MVSVWNIGRELARIIHVTASDLSIGILIYVIAKIGC